MELRERPVGRVVIVDVTGPVDRETETQSLLRDKVRDLLEQGYKFLILNVADVTGVDSLWLGAVVQAYTSAVRRGGTVKLLHVTARFRELLKVTRLDTVLSIFDSEEEATKSFPSSRR